MIPDSVAVVLLLLLLSALYAAFLYRRDMLTFHEYAEVLERQVDRHLPYCHTRLQRPSHPAEPYDWAKDGL